MRRLLRAASTTLSPQSLSRLSLEREYERMPKAFSPIRSDAHRIACLSLYRALLRECTTFTSSVGRYDKSIASSSLLRNLITDRFARNRLITRLSTIRARLKDGHSLLHLLHNSSNGRSSALNSLTARLAQTLDSRTAQNIRPPRNPQATPPHALPKAQHNLAQRTKSNHLPAPNNVPILNRPLPLKDIKGGRRLIPTLHSAQQVVPFLSYGDGRQSIYIGRIIRQKLKWQERMRLTRADLEVWTQLGAWEDDWDNLVQAQTAREVLGLDHPVRVVWEPRWRDAPKEVDFQIAHNIWRKMQAAGGLGAKMWSVVKREKKMKEWEELPENVAHAISVGMKLEWKVLRMAREMGRELKPLRRREDVVKDIVETRALGRFEVPVEWTEKWGRIDWEQKEEDGLVDLGRERSVDVGEVQDKRHNYLPPIRTTAV